MITRLYYTPTLMEQKLTLFVPPSIQSSWIKKENNFPYYIP